MADENERPPAHIAIAETDKPHTQPKTNGVPRDSTGWDGKLRLNKNKKAELVNPEAISDPEYSEEEQVLAGETIEADEDLLDDYEPDTEEIDCVHSRVSSIPSLRLERFRAVTRLCLRQNAITNIDGLSTLAATLKELDLYDNLIKHVRKLDDLIQLTSLDLSFNKISHIENIDHLVNLTDLYLVQNKVRSIQGLKGLQKLRNLELAANRIRAIENLESLTSLEELWLGKNKITQISGLDTLRNLKILSIQSNRIRDISGLDQLPNLQELYISHNALTSLKGLDKVASLRVLDISNNQVSNVIGLQHMTELEEFWASYNQIGDFAEVEKELSKMSKLTTVYFEGNPLQLKGPAVYRNKVRLMLPQVTQIDATFARV